MNKSLDNNLIGQDIGNTVLRIVQTCIDDFSADSGIKAHPDLSIDESGLDSLSMMELMTELEDAFEIEMPDDSPERVSSVRDLIELVHQCVVTQGSK